MSDNFDEFFDQNTQWVDADGTEIPSLSEPPAPPASRREMRKKRNEKKRKRIISIIAAIVAVALVAAGCFFLVKKIKASREAREAANTVQQIEDYPGPGGEDVSFTVESGQGAYQIAESLVQQDIIKSAEAFTSIVAANDTTLYPGTFQLKKQMKASDVVNILSDQTQAGGFLDVKPGDRVSAVIQNAATLTGKDVSEFQAIIDGGGDGILPAEAGGKFEGWLEPGSYNVQDKSASDIIKEMVDARVAKLDDLGIASDQRQRVLEIASIAQAEVNTVDAFGKVARVIENRLATGMNLGMDTSLAYGLNKTANEITDADIEDASNPYNLHKNAGLPPTPIDNPGDDAITQAANPPEGNWMYFVTVDLSTGETKFVETEDEFWQIRQEYKDNNENAN